MFISFEILFLVLPVKYVYENQLPPASSVIITCEQVNMLLLLGQVIEGNSKQVDQHLGVKFKFEKNNNLKSKFLSVISFIFVSCYVQC